MTTTQFTTMKELGAVIKSRRKGIKMRIDDFAAYAGVSVSLVSALENGSRPVGLDNVLKVCNSLGIELFAKGR